VGPKAHDLALQEHNNFAKNKEVKVRCNQAEYSKKGYGLKSAVLLEMMMMYSTLRRHAYRSQQR
jgi:hypothetical protein